MFEVASLIGIFVAYAVGGVMGFVVAALLCSLRNHDLHVEIERLSARVSESESQLARN